MPSLSVNIDGTGAEAGSRVVLRSLNDIAAAAGKAINPVNALEMAAKAAAGAFAGFQLLNLIRDSTILAGHAESIAIVLKKVAENVGYTSDQMDDLSSSVARLGMTNEGARQVLTKMIQTNIDLSNATKLTTIAQNAAVIAHTSTAEALDLMNISISTGMTRTLKHMGIIVDFSKAEKDYALVLGKNVALMTEKEKTQARVNDVIRASAQINGTFTASLSTAEGIMRQLSVATDETKDEFGKLFLPTYKEILLQLLTTMKDTQSWFEHNKGTVQEWSNAFLTVLYSIEAEVLRLSMLLDKMGGTMTSTGMLLFGPGYAIGNKNSTEQFEKFAKMNLDFQARYEENEKRIIDLAIKANAVNVMMSSGSGNTAAAIAGAKATKDREAVAAATLLLDFHNKLVSTSGKAYLEVIKLTGSQLEQAKAEELVYRSSKEYFDLMKMKDDVVVKGILHNKELVISLNNMKAAYDALHANDDVKNQLASLQVVTDPYASQMEAIRQRYEKEMGWQQELLKSTSLTAAQRVSIEERLSILSKARTQEEINFKNTEYRRGAQSFADSLNTIGQSLMQGNKQQFEIGKRMAEASNIISTSLGATQAFTSLSGIPVIGPELGVIAATAAITAGMINQARIEGQQYKGMAKGGYIADDTGTPGLDSVPAMLMPGEFVINKDAVKYYGLNNVVDINEFRKHKFGGGGFLGTGLDISSPTLTVGGTTIDVGTTVATGGMNYLTGIQPITDAYENLRRGTNYSQPSMTQAQLDEELARRQMVLNNSTTDQLKLYDLRISQDKELQQAQKDGLDITKLQSTQVQEYTKTILDMNDAQKKATDIFNNDLNSRLLKAQGRDAEATLYDLKIKQAQELQDAQQKGYDTTQLLAVQTLEYANAVKTASETVSAAGQKIIDSSKSALNLVITTQENILNSIKSIMTGPLAQLSPEAAYRQAQGQFNTATVTELPNAANALLTASKNYNASSVAYQTDLAQVLSRLGNASGIGSTPTLSAAEQQLVVLGQIKDLISSGNTDQLSSFIATQTAIAQSDNSLASALSAYLTSIKENTEIIADNIKPIIPVSSGSAVIDAANAAAAAGLPSSSSGPIFPNGEISSIDTSGNGPYLPPPPVVAPIALQRTIAWAQEGIAEITKAISLSLIGRSYTVDLMYDLNKSGTPDMTDLNTLSLMVSGVLPLPYYARGGLASGWGIVGEQGPELVNFSNPGRVYTADQTAAAMGRSNEELIAEIKALRQVVEAQGRALIQISQAGFNGTIEVGEKQAANLNTMASRERLARAK